MAGKAISAYEKRELESIRKWKAEEPGVVSKTFGIILEPAAWLVKKVVPEKAIQGAIDGANSLAEWLTDIEDIKRDGHVKSLQELKDGDLKVCDDLANGVHNWAIGIAVAEGGTTGLFGLPGMAADIPAIITLALRTIHKIGACYGFQCTNEIDKNYVLAILSASGANSIEEKSIALATLVAVRNILAKMTWKSMTQKAAQQQLSKEAGIIALRNLAKQLGVNMTKRKALAAIPIIGAAVGGSVNGWYIKEVGWAARRSFQERWLLENKKISN